MDRAHHLGDRGQALIDLAQPGRTERGHTLGGGALPQRLRGSIADQEPLDGVAHAQNLEHPDPPVEAGVRAEGAASAALEEHAVAADLAIELALLWRWLVGCGALGAYAADESLRQHAADGRAHHERLDPHLEEAVDRAHGISGMQ